MHPNRVYTLFCGAYAFGDPIRTIGEQAPQLKDRNGALRQALTRLQSQIKMCEETFLLIRDIYKQKWGGAVASFDFDGGNWARVQFYINKDC
jgi:hypothetical protein